MQKILILLIGLVISNVTFAQSNAFCEGYDTYDDECQKFCEIVYERMAKKYNAMYQKEEKTDALLIPYDQFADIFQDCGESKISLNEARSCMLQKMQKLVIKSWSQK